MRQKYKGTSNAPADIGRHTKLTEEQTQEIIYLYCEKGITQKAIAAHYGVSVRTIQYILNPDSRKKNYDRVMQEDKEQHRIRMKNIRAARRIIYNEKHSED